MTNTYHKQHAAQITAIMKALPSNASSLLKTFAKGFYNKVHTTDMEEYEPHQAAGLAKSAFDFFKTRDPGTPYIRIFKPNKKDHGYTSKNVVIELLNDDMPFLVDSLTAELSRQGLNLKQTIHPIFYVDRDKNGVLKDISITSEKKTYKPESFIHFEVAVLPEDTNANKLQTDLEWTLEYIFRAVKDWQPVVNKAMDHISGIEANAKFFDADTVSEAKDFMRWLINKNFVFLGYAEYDFFDENGNEKLSPVKNSKLGIVKVSSDTTFKGLESLPQNLRHLVLVPQLIEITKTMRTSPVHRPVPMDCIGIKRFNEKGEVIGEARFLGLFTSNVYYQSSEDIPLLRHKIRRILTRADFDPTSHAGKALKAILEFLPRDEIFQMAEDQLLETSLGILALEAKPMVRAFLRPDAFERFISAMVFVPRERFSTDLRHQIEALMEKEFKGNAYAFTTQITEAPLARLHLMVKTQQGNIPDVDVAELEEAIARQAYLWGDLLLEELQKQHPENRAHRLYNAYSNAFPQSYINRYHAISAVFDIDKMEEARKEECITVEFYRKKNAESHCVHLKIYSPVLEIALSDVLPMLEAAGFRAIEEYPFNIIPKNDEVIWLRDFKLHTPEHIDIDVAAVKPHLELALLQAWRGELENDRFNALIVRSGLEVREATMLRAYAKYLKQMNFLYDQVSIENAFNQQPHIAKHIVALFHARFDPNTKNPTSAQDNAKKALLEALEKVADVGQDRIFRQYSDLICATLRTNYYQRKDNGGYKDVMSFKFRSSLVPNLPLPHPHAEIFIYSAQVQGVHLRGGKVARGGLRWSDRHEDFRTEVLGLMKAQMTKNAVIVPVGSKGGFIVKQPPKDGGRDAFLEEGIACYKRYLGGMLDITDNVIKGKIIPPSNVIRHDDDDPYLVVAADKGTASFSDIANSVSNDYGFWLGDAFASGGSVGYDHKKMGITARGAWVSVTRHFLEMGVDITQEAFTVVGIGDMSGDVFGNGMLLSENIKLLAAFNHMHIFIDPNPDTKKSFAERKRMFNLPRSSWTDYNKKCISKGGAIFERSAKTVTLSKEAQTALGLTKATYTPDDLIKALLTAPVDLLWNGGIGTYVKAKSETDADVGDRANNAVRVNGNQLQCQIVGEGGNLGFTQKGRIEYAKLGADGAGGRINTDAIDNSAGVDCSDHEVNIKITFSGEVAKGNLTMKKRDALLADMTDDVARLVLRDNELQTQALTIAQQQGTNQLDSHMRLMQNLERKNVLDRVIEFLPSNKQITELKNNRTGLTRPELSVLLAYAKMDLYSELLGSSLPDEKYYLDDLLRYFPDLMRKSFTDTIYKHPLNREIIATVVTNSMINRVGMTFYADMSEDLGVPARDIAAAYTLNRDVFGLRDIWNHIEAAQKSGVSTQVEMYVTTTAFLDSVTRWVLRNLPLPLDMVRAKQEVAQGISELRDNLDKLHCKHTRELEQAHVKDLLSKSVPKALAMELAQLDMLSSAFDIIAVAHRTNGKTVATGTLYFNLGERLNLPTLRETARGVKQTNNWDRLAIQTILGDLYDEQRRLTLDVAESGMSFAQWEKERGGAMQRYDQFMSEFLATDDVSISNLMVAMRYVRGL